MGERRKRKSQWDMGEEPNHLSGMNEHRHPSHDSGRYHDFSAPRTTITPKSRDHSGWQSWDTIEENPNAPMTGSYTDNRQNAPEGKDLDGGKRYYKNMSPGFDGMEPRDYNHSHEYDRSHSQRRSGPDKICRDFASGSCRRGSQCRFSHPNSTNRREGDFMEDDTAESWRNRADQSRIPKHSYNRNDVSDPYQREDEQFVNKSRNAVPCKDFVRGNCRWGDTCRFSHHAASDGNNTFSKGTRNASFDKDNERQPYKEAKPLCKYFAAGKCDRDNCRFSHDDPNFNNVERRQDQVSDKTYEKSNWWNGPTWDDETTVSNNMKPTGWSETIVPNTNSIGETNDVKNDDRGGRSLETENKGWGIPEYTENSLNSEKHLSLPEESGSYGGPTTESIAKDNMAHNQEHLILQGSQLQNQDAIVNVHEQKTLQENRNFLFEALQENVYPVADLQKQHERVVENNLTNSFGSDVVKDPRYMTHPILFSGQSLNQNSGSMIPGNSSITSERSREQNMLSPTPSSGFSTDLNVPETHIVGPLSLQSQPQNNQIAVQSPVILEPQAPQILPNWNNSAMTNPKVSPVTNPKVFLTRRFENEQSQAYAADNSPSVPLVKTANVQPNLVAVSLHPFNPTEKSRDNNEQGNNDLAQGIEQNNRMQPQRSSPLSNVGAEFNSSKLEHPESSKSGQEVIANSDVTGGNKAIGEESKGGVEENKRSETLDGHGKVEEGNANKDEKGMRIFKNALIEFVKEILKPTWKEGRMSREAHKTVVKKVVDKVSSTIPVDRIPMTQDKVDLYLSSSKPKISKLVQAYVERSLKTDS
ncbi:hypothetical protein BUALT_Bualt08G0107200 [Buddleja alternifolia]|uniref:C3H1-type domain-containing protein n=1 Tax=Buddleja alternifolia TaxID=168488 RepID=A0AAV6X5R6_9LAMI|nr:hypothetical protein BUALT_Bualt08G0107200 [Buddleja alternifolia]